MFSTIKKSVYSFAFLLFFACGTLANAQIAQPLKAILERFADETIYTQTSSENVNPIVYTAIAPALKDIDTDTNDTTDNEVKEEASEENGNEENGTDENGSETSETQDETANEEPITIRLKYSTNENGVKILTSVTVTGLMSKANTNLASQVIGWASGYDDAMADSVTNFLQTRGADLAGQGSVPISAEEYTLNINVADAEEAPYDVTMKLSLTSVADVNFPEARHSLGASKEDATYIIREFSDFQCPFCTRFSQEILPQIEALIETRGDLRFEFHHFPLKSIHPNAVPAAEASECVAEVLGDEAFWEYHDALFSFQNAWGSLGDPSDYFVRLATDSNLVTKDDDEFALLETCITDRSYADTVENDYNVAANTLKLRGTPSMFVNGFKANNPYAPEIIDTLMKRVDLLANNESTKNKNNSTSDTEDNKEDEDNNPSDESSDEENAAESSGE